MEKLALISALMALPAVIFMMIANISGHNRGWLWLFVKIPSGISFIVIVVYFLKFFKLI